MSSDVTEFVFPPFEGRYSRFLSYPIVDCPSKLPYHPDTRKVYLLFESEQHNPKDGWQWGKGNKSNKDFFSNEPGYSKSFKFKCQNNSCPAVKFVLLFQGIFQGSITSMIIIVIVHQLRVQILVIN